MDFEEYFDGTCDEIDVVAVRATPECPKWEKHMHHSIISHIPPECDVKRTLLDLHIWLCQQRL